MNGKSSSGNSSESPGKSPGDFLDQKTVSALAKGFSKSLAMTGSGEAKVPQAAGGTAAVRSNTPGAVTSEPPARFSSEPPVAVSSEPPVAISSEPPARFSSEPPVAVSSEPPAAVSSEPPAAVSSEPPVAVSSEPSELPTTPAMVSALFSAATMVHMNEGLDDGEVQALVDFTIACEPPERQIPILVDLFQRILVVSEEPLLQLSSQMCQCQYCQTQFFMRIFGEPSFPGFDLHRMFFRLVFDTATEPVIPARIFRCLEQNLPSTGCTFRAESQTSAQAQAAQAQTAALCDEALCISALRDDPPSQLVFLLEFIRKIRLIYFGIFQDFRRSVLCPCSGCFLTDVELMLDFFTRNNRDSQAYFSGYNQMVSLIVLCLIDHQGRLQLDLYERSAVLSMLGFGGFGGFGFARGGGGVQEPPIIKDRYPGISGKQAVPHEEFPTDCPLCAEPAISEKGEEIRFVQTNCNHVSCETCSRKNWNSGCKNYNLCPVCRAKITSFELLEKLDDPVSPKPNASEDPSAGGASADAPESPKASKE